MAPIKMINCKAGFCETAVDVGKNVELDVEGFRSFGNDQLLKAGDGSKIKLRDTVHVARSALPTEKS